MSICFKAFFAVGETFRGVEWLRDELAAEPGAIHELVERWRHVFGPDAWSIQPLPVSALPSVAGRGGLSLTVGRRAIELHHMMLFSHFTGDAEERERMRAACLLIARLVGSPRAIYLHEMLRDGFDADATLETIEAAMRAMYGAPSPTFEALHAAKYYGDGCWYIDELG